MKPTNATQPLTFRQMEVLFHSARHYLKPVLCTLLLCLLGYSSVLGQGTFVPYGDTIFTGPHTSLYQAFDFEKDNMGNLYYKYDSLLANGVRHTKVLRNNGTGWTHISAPFVHSLGTDGFTTFSVSGNRLFLLSGNNIANRQWLLTAYEFVGNSWQQMGSSHIDTVENDYSTYTALHHRSNNYGIVVDGSGNPYICYRIPFPSSTYEQPSRPFVKRFDGTNWIDAGSASLDSTVRYVHMEVSPSGQLHLSYIRVVSSNYIATTCTFNGSTWTQLGGISSSALIGKLALDKVGTQYFTYITYGSSMGYRLMVFRWGPISWSNISPTNGFAMTRPWNWGLTFDNNNIPYIATDLVNVYKYNGSQWISHASAPISNTSLGFTPDTIPAQILFDNQNNLYAAVSYNSHYYAVQQYDQSGLVLKYSPTSLQSPYVFIDAVDTICSWQNTTLFAVTGNYSGPLTYQWAGSIDNGTTWSIAINCNCQSYNGGAYQNTLYRLIVSDGIRSDTAYKQIYGLRSFSKIDTIPNYYCASNPVTFTAVITDQISSNPTITWRIGNTIVGTGSTYAPTNAPYGAYLTLSVFDSCVYSADSLLLLPYPVPKPINISTSGVSCNASISVHDAPPQAEISWYLNNNLVNTTTANNSGDIVFGGNGIGTNLNQLYISSFSSTPRNLRLKVDALGDCYIPDQRNHRVLKFSPGSTQGVVVAGSSGILGNSSALLNLPIALDVDAAGNVYVGDVGNWRVQKWAPGATTGITVAGTGVAGPAADQLNTILDLHVDGLGNLYILDYRNSTSIRLQYWAANATSGTTLITFNPSINGFTPKSFEITGTDIYILTRDNDSYQIWKWPLAGGTNAVLVHDIPHIMPQYFYEYYNTLTIDSNENIYLGGYAKVVKLAAGDTVLTVVADNASFNGPDTLSGIAGIAIAPDGSLYINDQGNRIIRFTQTMPDTTYTPTQPGIYTAKVTMPWGCETVSNPITISTINVVDTIYQTINPGQSYQGYSATGIYMDTFALGNGCDSIRVLNLTVTPVNGLVWPGDANSDGVANMNDALYIGLGYNVVGPVRPNATNNWIGQPCPNWITTFGIGVNHHHGDCNGNGQIDANDTVPILQNYGLTHLKQEQLAQAGNPLLHYSPVVRNIAPNTRVYIPVALGMAPDSAENIYGIAFSLNYDESLVVPGSAYFQAVNSWLGNVNTDLFYIQKPLNGGVVDAAIARTDHTNRSGMGTIGTLSFITIDNISGKDLVEMALNLGFSNVTMIDNAGNILPVGTQSDSVLISFEVGIDNLGANKVRLLVYPNPATETLSYLLEGSAEATEITLVDVTGKTVLRHSSPQAYGQLDVAPLARGIYFLHVTSATYQSVQKVFLK